VLGKLSKKPEDTAMPRKFNPYDAKAFLQTIIVFVFLFGFLVATVAATGHGVQRPSGPVQDG
jgi:quinol-cytochrome oxidoreductase complex cytochrome b subunit